MYSLWRNNVQLGRLINVKEETLDDVEPAGFSALLFPLVDLDSLGTVKQTRFGEMPGSPAVQEFPSVPDPTQSSESYRQMYVIPPPAHTKLDADGRGVPHEEQFSIRTDDGADVPSYIIGIERCDLPPDVDASSDLQEAGLPAGLRCVFQVVLIHEHAYPPKHIVEKFKRHEERQKRLMHGIRALTIDDLSQVQALADEARDEGFRFVQRFADEMADIPLENLTQWFFGVFDAERLCAIGGVTPDPYTDDRQTGRIRRVYVVSALRGRGYGSRLMDALEERARFVYRVLRLSTDTPAAAAFYEKRGYMRTSDAGATHVRNRPTNQCEV